MNFMVRVIFVLFFISAFSSFLSGEEYRKNKMGFEDFTLCIDPGHPSETSDGSWKGNGISEVEMNWIIGEKLKKYMSSDYGIDVIMTKSSLKELVTNRKRAEIANENGADLFLRLHCDSGKRSGFTIYYPDRQGKRYGYTGPSKKIISESKRAAEYFHRGVSSILKPYIKDRGIKGDSQTYIGGKQGALTGSIFCKVPSILIEMGNLPNRNDAEFLKSKEGSRIMVEALGNGVIEYFKFLKQKKKRNTPRGRKKK